MEYKFWMRDITRTLNSRICKIIFFAEGEAEAHFLESWLSSLMPVPEGVAIHCFGGINKLPSSLKLITTLPSFQTVLSVGIMIDSDTDPFARQQSINAILRNFELIGANDNAVGQTAVFAGRKIAVHMAPDTEKQGQIEDLVLEEIRHSNEHMESWTREVARISQAHSEFSINPKSLVQSYLGFRKPGLCGTGRGFESQIFDASSEAYRGIHSLFLPILQIEGQSSLA